MYSFVFFCFSELPLATVKNCIRDFSSSKYKQQNDVSIVLAVSIELFIQYLVQQLIQNNAANKNKTLMLDHLERLIRADPKLEFCRGIYNLFLSGFLFVFMNHALFVHRWRTTIAR